MMEIGFWDAVTDQLKEEMQYIRSEVREMFKGTRPFRQPNIPDREKLFIYENIAPEVKQQFYQADPQGFLALDEEMNKLRSKYNAGT